MTHDVTLILDKNLNGALTEALRALNYDTIQSGGVIPEKTPDMKFIQITTEMGRTVVTSDQTFDQPDNEEEERILKDELDGELPDHPGIIIVPKNDELDAISYAQLAEGISRVITQYGADGLAGETVRAHNWI